MQSFLQDFRYTLRQWRQNPGFAAAVILILALGIAANAVAFTLLRVTLLRPLPYRAPDRLVKVWETRTSGDYAQMEASYPDFVDFRARNQVFESVGGYSLRSATIGGAQGAEQDFVTVVSSNFFDVLGIRPAIGRTFRPEEEGAASAQTVVLSYAGWQKRFGGSPAIIGQTVVINERPRTVVGVLPRDFQFAASASSEFWLPVQPMGWQLRRNAHWFHPVARLKPGMSIGQAQAGMFALAGQLALQYPDSNVGVGVRLVNVQDEIVGPVRPTLLILMAAVGCMLLITCANVAGLLLARAMGRRKEISVRLALGASAGRIVRQLLTESCALAFAGGIAGVIFSRWLLPISMAAVPKGTLRFMPAWQNLHVDAGFLLVALVFALATGVLFGLAPSVQLFRRDLQESLHESGRSSAGSGRSRLRNVLVVGEIAVAILLLDAGGLLVKSLWHVLHVDPGFRTEGLLTLQVQLPGKKYLEDRQILGFQRSLFEKLRSLPGVKDAASTSVLPMGGGGGTLRFVLEGHRNAPQSEAMEADSREISPNYFSVMGTPLRTGRFFTESDNATAPHVAIINQAVADRAFPGQNPIGKRIDFTYTKQPNLWTVVGIVADERAAALDAPPNPAVYTPFAQSPDSYLALLVRTQQKPEALALPVERAIREMDADVPVSNVATMTRIISDSPSIFLRRSPAYLITAFAAVGVLLAAIGLYGLLAYSVAQRGREFGIRMALGAQKTSLIALVIRDGMKFALAGAALGVTLAIIGARLLASFLFDVQPGDAGTMATVCGLVVIVALAAIYIPARRAAFTDPIEALRME